MGPPCREAARPVPSNDQGRSQTHRERPPPQRAAAAGTDRDIQAGLPRRRPSGGIPRDGVGIEGDGRQLRLRRDIACPLPVTDHSATERHARYFVRPRLCVPPGEKPAHGVSDENEREAKVIAPSDLAERVPVLDGIVEERHSALTLGASMSYVIVGIDDSSVTGEGLCNTGERPPCSAYPWTNYTIRFGSPVGSQRR
jgi:hypothetical protein